MIKVKRSLDSITRQTYKGYGVVLRWLDIVIPIHLMPIAGKKETQPHRVGQPDQIMFLSGITSA